MEEVRKQALRELGVGDVVSRHREARASFDVDFLRASDAPGGAKGGYGKSSGGGGGGNNTSVSTSSGGGGVGAGGQGGRIELSAEVDIGPPSAPGCAPGCAPQLGQVGLRSSAGASGQHMLSLSP